MGNVGDSVTVTVDVLFLAHGRREFTEASFKALCATLGESHRLWVYTDGGEPPDVPESVRDRVAVYFDTNRHGGPVACMVSLLKKLGNTAYLSEAPYLAKVDNDLVTCGGWLEACVDVMERYPGVDLLGVEPYTTDEKLFPQWVEPARIVDGEIEPPPAVRCCCGHHITQHNEAGICIADREKCTCFNFCDCWQLQQEWFTPRLVSHIGGIGVFRRSAFDRYGLPTPSTQDGRQGFTQWQWSHPGMVKAFMDPPLPVFLLDHLPIPRWQLLSEKYETTCVCGHDVGQHPSAENMTCCVCDLATCRGFRPMQRHVWGTYDPVKHKALWSWWEDKP